MDDLLDARCFFTGGASPPVDGALEAARFLPFPVLPSPSGTSDSSRPFPLPFPVLLSPSGASDSSLPFPLPLRPLDRDLDFDFSPAAFNGGQ